MGTFVVEKIAVPVKSIEASASAPKATDPKVRIRQDLQQRIKRIIDATPAGAGLNQTRIVEEAIEQWLHRRGAGAHAEPPIIRSDDEHRMVAAVLAAMRDRELSRIRVPILKALLSEELRKIPKGKRRAEEKEGAASDGHEHY